MKILLTILILFAFFTTQSFPQFDILEKVKKKVEEKAEEETDKAIDQGVDDAAEEIKGNKKNKTKEDEPEEVTEDEKTPKSSKKSFTTYTKFDFVPGTEIIFYDDFSMDAIADFPQKWNTNGSGEVVKLNDYPNNWFQLINATTYMPYIEANSFGENFTVEIDFFLEVADEQNYGALYVDFYQKNENQNDQVPDASSGPYAAGVQFEIYPYIGQPAAHSVKAIQESSGGHFETSGEGSSSSSSFIHGEVNRLSFAFNKQRFRAYLNEKKILDLPRLIKDGTDINAISLRTWYWNDDENDLILIKDIRIAQGQPDTRNELITKGKLVTRGILFDVNSDKIKPESYGTLKEIANVLKENSSIRFKIVGHTDSDGSDASNLDLSKRRAEAVKQTLANEFGIDAARMETDGKGELEPVGDNNTAEGKAGNRRVEFIKL